MRDTLGSLALRSYDSLNEEALGGNGAPIGIRLLAEPLQEPLFRILANIIINTDGETVDSAQSKLRLGKVSKSVAVLVFIDVDIGSVDGHRGNSARNVSGDGGGAASATTSTRAAGLPPVDKFIIQAKTNICRRKPVHLYTHKGNA